MEAVVNLRQWQLHLPSQKIDTNVARWMNKSFQEIRSLLPIYFDRTKTFATPLYGFDVALLDKRGSDTTTKKTEWNAAVTDFLARQDKLSGPPTAVAVLLDGEGTSNLHVERGFCLSQPVAASLKSGLSDAEPKREASDENNARVLWPAVYLRSTLHLTPTTSRSTVSSHGSGLIRSSQK